MSAVSEQSDLYLQQWSPAIPDENGFFKKSPGHESLTSDYCGSLIPPSPATSIQSEDDPLNVKWEIGNIDFSDLMDFDPQTSDFPMTFELPDLQDDASKVVGVAEKQSYGHNVDLLDLVEETAVKQDPVATAPLPAEEKIQARKSTRTRKVKHDPDFVGTSDDNALTSQQTFTIVHMPEKKEPFDAALLEKNQKNAIQARINRQKKKAYVGELENQVASLTAEKQALLSENTDLKREMESYKEEALYLKSVLANQSTLANLLAKIDTTEGVRLSSSFSENRKRSHNLDHDYIERQTKKAKVQQKDISVDYAGTGGVCLHVDKNNVSLEFCSQCALKAQVATSKGKR